MSEKLHSSSRKSQMSTKAPLHGVLWAACFALLVTAVCFTLRAQGQTPPQQAAPKPPAGEGNVAHGKELFIKNGCYQCHGYVGQGGTKAGVRIAPDPLPWQAIAAYIRKPAGDMPPYSSKLIPDSDVQDITSYLKSVPPPVDIKRIPTFTK